MDDIKSHIVRCYWSDNLHVMLSMRTTVSMEFIESQIRVKFNQISTLSNKRHERLTNIMEIYSRKTNISLINASETAEILSGGII